MEYIKIVGNPLELYFALSKPLVDSTKQCFNSNRFDDAIKHIDIRDSLYNDLLPDDRTKVSYTQNNNIFDRAAAYSAKGNVDDAMRLLKEMKAKGWDYMIDRTINDS